MILKNSFITFQSFTNVTRFEKSFFQNFNEQNQKVFLSDDAQDPQSLRCYRFKNIRATGCAWNLPARNANDLTAGNESAAFIAKAQAF